MHMASMCHFLASVTQTHLGLTAVLIAQAVAHFLDLTRMASVC